MFYYAQIDEKNICIGISQLSREVISDNLIQVDSVDNSILGKKYSNGTWEETEQPEPIPLPLSPTEQAILQTAINTEYMMSLMEVKG